MKSIFTGEQQDQYKREAYTMMPVSVCNESADLSPKQI